jgi:homoserine kinase
MTESSEKIQPSAEPLLQLCMKLVLYMGTRGTVTSVPQRKRSFTNALLRDTGECVCIMRIRVPASTSNLGPAFDAVGLALQLYLSVEVQALDKGPSHMEVSGEDAHLIPAESANLIWHTMKELAGEAGSRLPFFVLKIENQIPVSKGLGGSAAALLVAAAATSFLCGFGWGAEKLLEIVAKREGHPDNAAPSLWGGLVASIQDQKILCSKLKFPSKWTVVSVTPNLEVPTKIARSVLPGRIARQDAIYNIQRTAFLIAQLIEGRGEGLREAMSDLLHQPYRYKLVPGLEEILSMEDRQGLLGIALSGAGPTVVAFADSHEAEIAASISDIFKSHGLSAQSRLLKADNTGLVIE